MSGDVPASVPSLPDGLLLEGIVTTLNNDGTPHIAPMGPIVDADFARLLLRPFRSSVTYRNLKRSGQGVLHVTDDVALFARAAVGRIDEIPKLLPAKTIDGVILADACRWYAFRVTSHDDRGERAAIVAEVVERGLTRHFFGFNRAKHAVIEAAILATRTHLLDSQYVLNEYERLAVLVVKTGGRQEHTAFDFLWKYVRDQLVQRVPTGNNDG